MDAGFTFEQLSRVEQALDSGTNLSPNDLRLPKYIVSAMVQRKLAGTPWKGPLPAPRISPPRTLGDFLAKANQQNLGSRGGSVSSSRQTRSPARPVPARQHVAVSKFFEVPEFQGIDPNFPPLPSAALPASAACTASGATGKAEQGVTGPAEQVLIGPGKPFQPTKGLSALFKRTEPGDTPAS